MATVTTCKTLPKISQDEPMFVLRAQDMCAAEVVRHWAAIAFHVGAPVDKVQEAIKCAEAMEAWPNRKIPD